VELARAGATEITVQTHDAARWSARPPQGCLPVTVQATRQDRPEDRLDELVCSYAGPMVVLEPLAVVAASDLELLCRQCAASDARVGVLRTGQRVLAVWLDVGPARVRPGLLDRVDVACIAKESRTFPGTSSLHDALLERTSCEAPEGWLQPRPGVHVHPTAQVAADVIRSCSGPVWFHADCAVGEAVAIHGPAVIGAGSVLEAGVSVHASVVGPGTRVRSHVELDHALAVGPACWSAKRDHWNDLDPGPTASVDAMPAPVEVAEQLVERTLAGVALVVLAPVLGLAALAIRVEDGGTVLYRGRRSVRPAESAQGPGWRREHAGRFVRYPVLRTMVTEADREIGAMDHANEYASGPFKKCSTDPRVTRPGHWLRKASIDELPLLWEVFRGRLRLTGLWALPTYEARELADPTTLGDLAPCARLRFEGPAGLAGFWQSRDRGSHDPVARIVHDAYQAVVFGPSGPFSPRERAYRRMSLAVETVLSALKLGGV
jgi:lipopolysaccharide/colanic/teichoic acid biosynthesis glycosyltransferase